MENYPSRVTLFDDGIYRWSYDMDMWHNRYLLGLASKIISLLLGVPTLFIAAMVLKQLIPRINQGLPKDEIMWFIQNDLLALVIVGGLWIGIILLMLIIYAITAAVLHGTCRLCFQMDESAVVLVRDPKTMNAVNTFGTVVAVIGLAIGKTGDAMRMGSTLAAANSTGTSRFDSTRRVKILPKYDLLDLREWFGMNQIYVNSEDYEFVKGFILEHIPDKARERSA
ncbi:MAG: hypothetical protein IJ048_14140 [Clostridia bacterium]|nr:hypothetical protein [Clostridia bacterium]